MFSFLVIFILASLILFCFHIRITENDCPSHVFHRSYIHCLFCCRLMRPCNIDDFKLPPIIKSNLTKVVIKSLRLLLLFQYSINFTIYFRIQHTDNLGVVSTMTPVEHRLRQILVPEMLATDIAEYLVRKGLPFRETHHIAGI